MAKVQFLTVADVLKMTTFSESTLWRKVNAEIFPKPVKLSKRRVGWREKDVLKWVADLDDPEGKNVDEFTKVARKLADGTMKGQIILGGDRKVNILPTNKTVEFRLKEQPEKIDLMGNRFLACGFNRIHQQHQCGLSLPLPLYPHHLPPHHQPHPPHPTGILSLDRGGVGIPGAARQHPPVG